MTYLWCHPVCVVQQVTLSFLSHSISFLQLTFKSLIVSFPCTSQIIFGDCPALCKWWRSPERAPRGPSRAWVVLRPSGLILMLLEVFPTVKQPFCKAGMGMLQTPNPLLLSRFSYHIVPAASGLCAPMYLSSPRPCDVWPRCCLSLTDDWKTCLRFAEETCSGAGLSLALLWSHVSALNTAT